MTRVHFLTLGCPKNEVDSRGMSERLQAAGALVVGEANQADVLVVNTCAFIEDAVTESVETILEAAGGWKAAAEGRRLVVTGCLPSRYGDDLAAELPEVDAFVPVSDEDAIVSAIGVEPPVGRPTDEAGGSDEAGGPGVAGGSGVGPSAYLTACDGCDRTCAFCTIPAIRGPFRSRALDDIVGEGARLIGAGARELVLVGQDVSAYGRDTGADLPTLVARLAGLDGLSWLRLMYLQPDGVDERLLAAMAGAETVCHYLDIPLQHASRDVLRRMGRRGDPDEFLSLLDRVRAAMPDVVLRTTLIAGFPGETDDDIEILEGFLREAAIEHVGVFTYSPEDGTPAALLPDRVAPELAAERARSLRAIADDAADARFRSLIGSTLDVLVEDVEDGTPVGRWYGQAPEIDGVVHIEGDVRIGAFVRARVLDAIGHDLVTRVEA